MTDIATLFEIVAYTALVVAPTALLVRLLAGSEGPSLTDVLRVPIDAPWPRGVQEEEPAPWQLERLRLRSAAVDRRMGDCPPVGLAYPGTARPKEIG